MEGFNVEVIGEEDQEEESDDFEVWPENWETVNWFLRLQRRWVVGSMGGFIRLDDQAIVAQFGIYHVKKKQRPELFKGLLIMETAALDILNCAE